MAISTVDGQYNALGNSYERFLVDKSSIANLVAGQQCSMWRATGVPGQGAIPTTAVIPTAATAGAITPQTNQTAPVKIYLAWLYMQSSLALISPELYDRVAHQAGLSLTSIVSQTTNLPIDVSTLSLVAARRGVSNYSQLQWYLEVYADGGATVSNATINVTYNDASTGNLNVIAVGGTLRAGRWIALTPFIPTAQQGLYIRGINSVINSASTTVAGNFGFTCVAVKTGLELPIATKNEYATWDQLGNPDIPNDACLMIGVTTSTTSSGTLKGGGKFAYG